MKHMMRTIAILMCVLAWRGGGVDARAAETVAPAQPPRILLAKGVWYNYFRPEEALAALGSVQWKSAWYGRIQGGESLRWFEPNAAYLDQFRCLMFLNVGPVAMGKDGPAQVAAFIRAGGGVLFGGGPYVAPKEAAGWGALAELLPCDLPKGGERKAIPGGAVLAPTTDGSAVFKAVPLAWDKAPRAYYAHAATVREGSKVLVTMGDAPFLVTRETDKGRVAFIAASVEGEAADAQIAFWDWDGFIPLMTELTRWLMAGKADGATAAMPEDIARLVATLPESDVEVNVEQARAAMARILPWCRDAATAQRLFTAAHHVPLSAEKDLAERVARAVRPYVQPDWAEDALELARHPIPANAGLGLQCLGATRHAEAGALLAKALKEGAAILKTDAPASSDDMGMKLPDSGGGGLEPGVDKAVRLGAMIGLGLLGDTSYLPALQQATATYGKSRQELLNQDLELHYAEELYQESLVARLRLGDATAVDPFRNVLMKNIEEIEGCYNYFDDMVAYSKKDDLVYQKGLKTCYARLPELRFRQEQRLEALAMFSPAIRKAFLLSVCEWTDPVQTEMAFWAALPAAQTDAEWLKSLAEKSRSNAIRYYANSMLRQSGGK